MVHRETSVRRQLRPSSRMLRQNFGHRPVNILPGFDCRNEHPNIVFKVILKHKQIIIKRCNTEVFRLNRTSKIISNGKQWSRVWDKDTLWGQ